MEIIQLVSFGLIGTILISVIGKEDKTYGLFIRIAITIILFLVILTQLESILTMIMSLAGKIQMESTYLSIVFKIVGIAYISEMGYQLCKDAGEEAIGSKVQLAGKMMIFALSAPVILALMDLITQVLE
jgi:stage III sporulation protein AD